MLSHLLNRMHFNVLNKLLSNLDLNMEEQDCVQCSQIKEKGYPLYKFPNTKKTMPDNKTPLGDFWN